MLGHYGAPPGLGGTSCKSQSAAAQALQMFAKFEADCAYQQAYGASVQACGAAHAAASAKAEANAAKLHDARQLSGGTGAHSSSEKPSGANSKEAAAADALASGPSGNTEASSSSAGTTQVSRAGNGVGSARDEGPFAAKEEKRYIGKVKAFNSERGFGFIQCAEILKMFGCDVFLTHAVEGGLIIGSTVSFKLQISREGKPQARQVVLVEQGFTPNLAKPVGDTSKLTEKVFTGRVKSFNLGRGFGFLVCPELMHTFGGRDIYVARNHAPYGKLNPGQEVQFRLLLDRYGQPQAREIVCVPSKPPESRPPAPTSPSDVHIGFSLFK